MRLIRKLSSFSAALLLSGSILLTPLQAHAASTPINTGAKISFTFDDGLNSAYTNVAPIMAKHGLTATDYVISGCVGMTTAPNTCHANTDALYMDWNQVTALQNTYGWEIGSHTVTHPYLASKDATDGQPQTLTPTQVTTELTNSKTTLASHGINATDFASPYGDYNQAVLAQIAKLYASHRGFADTGYNATPYNNYIIRDQQVQAGVSVATVEGYVNTAIANKQWLVLTFHDVLPNASTNPDDYQYKTTDLDTIAAYVKSKNVPVVHVNDGLISGTNMLTDATFDNGIANGWTTDASTNIVKDTGNNGSFPSPTNSAKLTATTKNVHLFSPKVAVDSTNSYILQNFLNLSKVNSGYGLSYYVDEYDANGVWISGQYKQSVNFPWPQTTGFEYKPTSANVKSASLQLAVPANSGITAYVDNFQWINENNSTATTPANTFGKSTVGTLSEVGGANYLDSNGPYTLSAAASVSKLTGYVKAAGTTAGKIRAVIYTDNNGTPGTVVGTSNEVTVSSTTPGWIDFNLPAPVNLAAGKYWLGYWYGGGVTVYEDTVASSEKYTPATYSSTTSAPASYGTASTSSSSYSLYATFAAATTPPPPTQTNLVANGTFDAGIIQGWTTDGPTFIVADNANNGSPANSVNSVKMTSTTANKHLFSPKVAADSTKSYNISTYVNIKQMTSGEIGFYMDEYDANGNWISGKYITGARAVGATTVSFNYTPTSASVKSASLQIILQGNSGIVAYVDNVIWAQN